VEKENGCSREVVDGKDHRSDELVRRPEGKHILNIW
jgi:hypothetical protein